MTDISYRLRSMILMNITVIDYIQSVVGDIIPETDHAHFQIQRPDIRIRNPPTDTIIETFRSDVPDLLSLHGKLSTT